MPMITDDVKQKILVSVIDKLILGLLILIIAFFLNSQLQYEQSLRTYQSSLIQKRLEAYENLLIAGEALKDAASNFYDVEFGALLDEDEGFYFEWRFNYTKWKVEQQGGGDGRSLQYPRISPENFLITVENFENQRREGRLYLQESTNLAVDKLIEIVLNDLDEWVEISKMNNEESFRFQTDAWLHVSQAYNDLKAELLGKLRFDGLLFR